MQIYRFQNVSRWVKENVKTLDSRRASHQVANLLHTANHDDYVESLKEISESWDDEGKLLNYFKHRIEPDLMCTWRPKLEGLNVYDHMSGITNNAAESSNAAFKKVLDVKTSTLFQALSAWYFWQVGNLFEITRGTRLEGNFRPKRPIPAGVYIPQKSEDVIPEEVIKSLVYEGKLPRHLSSREVIKVPSIHERTTLRGIAKFFVDNDRVKLETREKVFLVKGLNEKCFMVQILVLCLWLSSGANNNRINF